jgi:Aspartyl protease
MLCAVPWRAVAAQTAAGRLDEPPAGLASTDVRLARVLADHEKAIGTRAVGQRDSVIEDWTFVDSGMSGAEDLQRDGTDYHSRIVYGPFVDEYGQRGQMRWHQDANGFTSATTEIDERSFYATRVAEDAADPKNDASVIGETSGAHPAYVVEVKRPGKKHPEFVFYDADSAQIVRIESPTDKRRLVETFDDFRITDGMSRPWHIHDTDGRPELDDDWKLTSLQQGVNIPESAFEMAPNAPHVLPPDAPSTLPGKMMFGTYIVRIDVGGRGLDFWLDSSASESIIDWDVAREMGLPDYGQATQLPDGTKVSFLTRFAHATAGGITLDNFTLRSKDFIYQPDVNTKVVGVLGYDFFAANVLHFDFTNHSVEALPLAGFASGDPTGARVDIPFTLDDGLPFVHAGIGDVVTDRAVLSTIMPSSFIFGSFVEAHPSEVTDRSGKTHAAGILPVANAETYGTKVETWTGQLSHFRFALSDYQQVGIPATNFTLTLGDRPVDAVIGTDYLRFYDVYFDYPYGRITVKPNALFFKTFKPSG